MMVSEWILRISSFLRYKIDKATKMKEIFFKKQNQMRYFISYCCKTRDTLQGIPNRQWQNTTEWESLQQTISETISSRFGWVEKWKYEGKNLLFSHSPTPIFFFLSFFLSNYYLKFIPMVRRCWRTWGRWFCEKNIKKGGKKFTRKYSTFSSRKHLLSHFRFTSTRDSNVNKKSQTDLWDKNKQIRLFFQRSEENRNEWRGREGDVTSPSTFGTEQKEREKEKNDFSR